MFWSALHMYEGVVFIFDVIMGLYVMYIWKMNWILILLHLYTISKYCGNDCWELPILINSSQACELLKSFAKVYAEFLNHIQLQYIWFKLIFTYICHMLVITALFFIFCVHFSQTNS